MNTNLIVFNIAFYLGNFLLYEIVRVDASNALSIGIIALIHWIVSVFFLIFFINRKTIKINTMADKIAAFTATPILIIIAISLLK